MPTNFPYGHDTLVIPAIFPAGFFSRTRSADTGYRPESKPTLIAERLSIAPIPRRLAAVLTASADEPDDEPVQLDPIPGTQPHPHSGHHPSTDGMEPHRFEPLEIPAPLLGGLSARPPGSQIVPATPRGAMRQNLIGAGELDPEDTREAHHVAPQGRAMNGNRNHQPAQRQMQKFGVDLNSIENGVALSPAFHRRLHTTEYYDYVNRRLRDSNSRAEVQRTLEEIGRRLALDNEAFEDTGQMPPWKTR